MHYIVHDFAQFLSRKECVSIGIYHGSEESVINSFDEKDHHLMLTL